MRKAKGVWRGIGLAGNVEMAKDAEKNCPGSKVLNAAITLDAKSI